MFMAVFRHCYLRVENRVSENIMRIGKSPTRYEITEYSPARVTLAILVSIPSQVGYYAQRLDILKLCLESAVSHAGVPVDLLVFDNGSSLEVRQYLTELHKKGFIQYLIFSSQNIGKIGALKIMFSAAPGEIVAYADDDIFFYPEWLSVHLDILDNFPRAGLISGCPVREQFKYSNLHLGEILDSTPLLSSESGHLIPDELDKEFRASTGRGVEENEEIVDIVLHHLRQSAYATATHFQFVATRTLLLQALNSDKLIKWSGRMMGQMREMDQAIDELKVLRLTTINRLVRHIGNTLTPEFVNLAKQYGIGDLGKPVQPREVEIWRRLSNIRVVRMLAKRLYNFSYRLLNSELKD